MSIKRIQRKAQETPGEPPARGGLFGGFMRPGQIETRHVTERSEVVQPDLNVWRGIRWRAWRYVMYSLPAIIPVVALLFFGPVAVLVLAYASIFVAAAWATWWLGVQFWNVIAPCAAFALVCATLFAVGYRLGFVVIVWQIPVFVVVVWLIGGAMYAIIEGTKMGEYRQFAEAVDPNHSPTRQPVARITPIWPWTEEPGAAGDPSQAAMLLDIMQEIARKLEAGQVRRAIGPTAGNWAAHGNGNTELPRPAPVEAGAPVVIDGIASAADAPQEIDARMDGIEAPSSGRWISIAQLAAFAQKAPDVSTRAGVWKRMAGWNEDAWRDAIDIWANVLGCLEPGKPGQSARFTVNIGDALDILDRYVVQYLPTYDAVES